MDGEENTDKINAKSDRLRTNVPLERCTPQMVQFEIGTLNIRKQRISESLCTCFCMSIGFYSWLDRASGSHLDVKTQFETYIA